MRRKDREISDFNEIVGIIEKCDAIRIALIDQDGMPYIVPMNFGHEVQDGELTFYFHCAGEGKKLDLIRRNNNAAFEMDCGHRFIMYEERMSCTMGYESVMGRGTIEFVPENEKMSALKCLMRHYHEEEFKFNPAMVPVTTVLKMTVTEFTGKRRNNVKK